MSWLAQHIEEGRGGLTVQGVFADEGSCSKTVDGKVVGGKRESNSTFARKGFGAAPTRRAAEATSVGGGEEFICFINVTNILDA